MAGFDVKTLLWSMSVLVAIFSGRTTEAAMGFDNKISGTTTKASADVDVEHDYNIDIVRVETRELSPIRLGPKSYLADSLVGDKNVINAVIELKTDLPESMVSVVALEMNEHTNQWVEKFRLANEFCDFIEKNKYLVDNIFKDSNLPRACPIKKGEYFIRNMVVDNKEFPKHLEEASWRVDADITAKATNAPIAMITVYANIVPMED